jgi:hypothetical protein
MANAAPYSVCVVFFLCKHSLQLSKKKHLMFESMNTLGDDFVIWIPGVVILSRVALFMSHCSDHREPSILDRMVHMRSTCL